MSIHINLIVIKNSKQPFKFVAITQKVTNTCTNINFFLSVKFSLDPVINAVSFLFVPWWFAAVAGPILYVLIGLYILVGMRYKAGEIFRSVVSFKIIITLSIIVRLFKEKLMYLPI